jgi:F-type H+-transporting ATPase subunit b
MRRRARCAGLMLFVFASLAFAQEGKSSESKSAEPDMTRWKWANFAILVAGLGYLVVKQGGPYFAARSQEIRKGIEEAQKLRADADARAAAMDAKLASLTADVETTRKASREEAAQEDARIRQETERDLAKVQANVDHEIASALKAAQLELKRYSAQLAVDLAGTRVREAMTPAAQDTLVRNFVTELGRQGPGGSPIEQGTTS